jgi:biotin transport system permease protein
MLALTSPIETPFHRLPAAAKLAALALFTFAVFLIARPAAMLVPLGVVALLYSVAGRRFVRQALRALRPIWIFVAAILLWHVVTGDVARGLMLAGRILATVALANLVTMTTRLDDMVAVVTALLQPLRKLGVKVGHLGFAIALVVRFTPVLIGKGRALGEAWRARSPRAPRWSIVVPLTLTAIDDAEHVAEAIKARGGLPG